MKAVARESGNRKKYYYAAAAAAAAPFAQFPFLKNDLYISNR
jgi:hypothetical protein